MSVKSATAQQKFRWKSEDPTDLFELIQCIDEGTFGQVWRGKSKAEADAQVAIKIITDPEDVDELDNEIRLLESFDSDFIIRFHGSWRWNDEIWIVMELADLGALEGLLIYCDKTFTEPEIAAICARVLLGLDHMHSKGFIHRDIKAKNILLTLDGQIKLADLGLTVHQDDVDLEDLSGTIHYMSPEMLRGDGYNGLTDIWSLGITIKELTEKEPPFAQITVDQNNGAVQLLNNIVDGPPPKFLQPFKWSADLQRFLSDCVTKDVTKRPTAAQILEHAFVKHEVAKAKKGNHEILQKLAADNFETLEKYRQLDEQYGGVLGGDGEAEDEYGLIDEDDESEYSDSDDSQDMMMMNTVQKIKKPKTKKSRKKTLKSRKSGVSVMRKAFNDGKSVKPKMRAHKEKVQTKLNFTTADLEAQLNNLNAIEVEKQQYSKAQLDRAQGLISRLIHKKKEKRR
mmetsp:Transcript_3221/g.4091  ORF Transcript_3221/g.4091 Transcript_3221/m.4091 type:complete len:455 (+) Transcript_3221:91-1455(+)